MCVYLNLLAPSGGLLFIKDQKMYNKPELFGELLKQFVGKTFLRVRNRKLIFLFLNQNICCGY